ncbi:MAG: TVP38/TMEM64 family protein [Nitratireductor sp.]
MDTGTEKMALVGTSSWPRRILPVLAIVASFAFAWIAGLFDYVSLSSLLIHRAGLADFVSAHQFASLALYMMLYAALVAISFPGASLLTIASGFLFGGLVGGAATVIGATAGAALIFLVARSSFGDFLSARAGPFVTRMLDGFNKDAFNYLLSLRLTPVFPFWVVNIVPALLNMRFVPYILATFLGIIPGTLAYSFIGAGLDSVIMAQEEANPGCAAAGTCHIDPSALVTRQIIVAMVAMAAISILPVLYKKFRARNQNA